MLSLLFVNVALFTWCVNQFLDKAQPKKTLISPVQATTTLSSESTLLSPPSMSMTQQSASNSKNNNSEHSQTELGIILQFQPLDIHLNAEERVKLENKLRQLNINSSHSARIFIGAAFAKNKILSPQTAKLRGQSVARWVYLFTQSVKMFYRPTITEGVVIVEFIDPSMNNKK